MSDAPVQWPVDQCFLTAADIESRSARCEARYRDCLRGQRIDADLTPLLGDLFLPLSAWLERRRGAQRGALVVGICGAQGSGKSTFAALLTEVLEAGFGTRVAAFSLDDVYLTAAQRQEMARELHPLFATRGVPGTHDVSLAIGLIESLCNQRPGQRIRLPVFDKARDTRLPEPEWRSFDGPADVIIFEGWCVGARPQDEAELATPVNALEREEDPDGIWRRTVNRALAGPYQSLFGQIDVLLLLRVQGMAQVLRWRRLQERKLAAKSAGADPASLKIMSGTDIERFVMHFERLTRRILAEMPDRADIVLGVDDSHIPATARINKPLR